MRSTFRFIAVLWIAIFICAGCTGSRKNLQEIPPTILTLEPGGAHIDRIALLLTHTPDTPVGRGMGELYVNTLAQAMRDQAHNLWLVTTQDPEMPNFFERLIGSAQAPSGVFELAAESRQAGYQGWATARIENIREADERTGFLWFRKISHFIFFDLDLVVYDAFTGAKLLDSIAESSVKITSDEYDAFKAGQWAELESLHETVTDRAEEQGEKAAEVIDAQPWRTAVVKVQGDRIFLSAGSRLGLKVGDRLAVLDARRTILGQKGEKFIVPGFEVGQIEIVDVDQETSEGKVLDSSGAPIQVGDTAVAID